MDKEQAIEEVMELVDDWSEKEFVAAEARLNPWSENAPSAPMQMLEKLDKEANDARKAIESKLRELLDEAHQVGYEAGWAEADEAMSWDRSM